MGKIIYVKILAIVGLFFWIVMSCENDKGPFIVDVTDDCACDTTYYRDCDCDTEDPERNDTISNPDCDCDVSDFQDKDCPCDEDTLPCDCDVTSYNDPDCPCDESDPELTGVSYQHDIKPIWEKYNCMGCHNPNGEHVSLDLRDEESYSSITEGGHVNVNNPENSNLYIWVAIGGMPPTDEELTDDEIQLIRDWIEEGAENN